MVILVTFIYVNNVVNYYLEINLIAINQTALSILQTLRQNGVLQRKILLAKLLEETKFSDYDKGIFTVTLQKKLNPLVDLGYVDKDDRGHQKVFYKITEAGLKKLKEVEMKEGLDKWYDSLTFDQKKHYSEALENIITKTTEFDSNLLKDVVMDVFPKYLEAKGYKELAEQVSLEFYVRPFESRPIEIKKEGKLKGYAKPLSNWEVGYEIKKPNSD